MRKQVLYGLLAVLFPFWLHAQPSEGGLPMSLRPEWKELAAAQPIGQYRAPALDMDAVRADDAARGGGNRFAAPIAVDIDPAQSGQWLSLPNGDRIWRLQITSPGALALAVFYDDFYLPKGAKLYMYSPNAAQVRGAYTSQNNPQSGRFFTGLITGPTAIVEYYEPGYVGDQGSFHIFRIDHAYRSEALEASSPDTSSTGFGFGCSLPCQINGNCSQGNNWSDQKRSVCRIVLIVEEGMGYCTGTLMNNTANDGKPYVLTAFHCQDGYTPLYDLWRFDFNYTAVGCSNPASEPPYQSVLGSQLRAGRQANDFLLIEMTAPIPYSYNVYFAGWDRSTVAPQQPFMFHHPHGDIRKISGAANSIIFTGPINWSNEVTTPASHHFRIFFTYGTFELGSSGASLFNNAGRVVAQLHGGFTECVATSTAYYGRLTLSWDGGGSSSSRLKDWLDPLGLSPTVLDGMNQPIGETGTVSGEIRTDSNQPVGGVLVRLVRPSDTLAVTTTINGQFNFTDIELGQDYSLLVSKNVNAKNGVSTQDIILIRKHILNVDALDSPYSMLAADVNNSGTITTTDLIQIQKVILSVVSQFDNVPSWRFLPASFAFPNPTNPFPDTPPFGRFDFTLDSDTVIDFKAMKSGDANNSADPGM